MVRALESVRTWTHVLLIGLASKIVSWCHSIEILSANVYLTRTLLSRLWALSLSLFRVATLLVALLCLLLLILELDAWRVGVELSTRIALTILWYREQFRIHIWVSNSVIRLTRHILIFLIIDPCWSYFIFKSLFRFFLSLKLCFFRLLLRWLRVPLC